ncbi:hypothetical protein [Paludibacter jiangxiensis]|uniref:Uncharacterized protein n=1 Tax=Paludibacter jiangxiensis TaxID=681398 RepID=A0A170ZRR3_9BACT|nr:hypothetical protein [Paludibacter jiangxiensis]GAT62946.1 hypothetical protein PJIAN_3258 [Paludibacter jiangxiensis]
MTYSNLFKSNTKIQFLVLILLGFIGFTSAFAKEFQTDLNGFRLKQFRTVPKNELKNLLQKDKFEDGFEYEMYAIKPDTSVYMTFEYDKADLNVIWSIQVTGRAKGYDCKFKGLTLGMSKDEVEHTLGQPSSKVDAGEYGTRWEYEGTNYSVEINSQNQLSSIKIMNISDKFFPRVDATMIPSFEQFSAVIRSGDRKKIINLLDPDIEIYEKNETYSFERAIDSEIDSDASGVFRRIETIKARLELVNPTDSTQYEENIRIMEGRTPMHVAKIKTAKNYTEIVFNWTFGKYRIWEIKLD